MTPVRLEPAALRSRVKHSTTEPLRSLPPPSPPLPVWLGGTIQLNSDDITKLQLYQPNIMVNNKKLKVLVTKLWLRTKASKYGQRQGVMSNTNKWTDRGKSCSCCLCWQSFWRQGYLQEAYSINFSFDVFPTLAQCSTNYIFNPCPAEYAEYINNMTHSLQFCFPDSTVPWFQLKQWILMLHGKQFRSD